MAWETDLDRLILQQIHLAEKGNARPSAVRGQIAELWRLAPERPQSAFHLGYARVLLGVELPSPVHADALRWFDYGRLRAHDRRGERNWLADLLADPGRMFDLLAEPEIARQCLPLIMRTLFWVGDLTQAVKVIDYLASTHADATDLVVDAALTDLLARVESRSGRDGDDSALAVLSQCIALPAFNRLPKDVQARYHRAKAVRLLAVSEFDEAGEQLRKAVELADGNDRLQSHACFLGALVALRLHDIGEVEPRADRPERDAAAAWLQQAASDADRATPELLFLRGVLAYEQADYPAARAWFDAGARAIRRTDGRDARLLDRMRFFLAASILAADDRDEAARALRLMEQALDSVHPDLESFYPVHEALKVLSRKVALKFLDAVDVGRGTAPDQLLFVALEYQSLGEADAAAAAAERVLQVAVDLDQRIEAMRLLLTCENMRGRRDMAREMFFSIRDLLMQRGALAELETLLKNEEFVGQALDQHEIRCELVALFEEMEGREADKATLQLGIARSLRARKDVDALREAHGILREVAVAFPEMAADELQALAKLLAIADGEPPTADEGCRAARQAAAALGRPARVLVVGGNERQRRHHPRFEQLIGDWGVEGEWLMANYVSPNKVVNTIAERIKGDRLDLLVLLHWNRHETTEPALELARKAGIPARTVHYAGFTSLQVALGDMLGQLAEAAAGKSADRRRARA